jgi:hypothetical protein
MKIISTFLLLFTACIHLQAQLHLSAETAGGINSPKIKHDGTPAPNDLYNAAFSYRFGIDLSYQIGTHFCIGARTGFQSFAYTQRSFTGTFQQTGVIGGLYAGILFKRFQFDLGGDYTSIINKSFADPEGIANPNFYTASLGASVRFKKIQPFFRYYHGISAYHKYKLGFPGYRYLYVREILLGVAYQLF